MAKGDHLFMYCLGYSHHGIDCGHDRVIHFETSLWQKLGGRRARDEDPPTIREVGREEFAQGRAVIVRNYLDADDPDTVVERARSRLGETGYRLFDNNCEHFAAWCKTGQSDSTQIRDLVDATWPMAAGIPAATGLLRSTRYLRGRARTMAYAGAVAVTAGAFVQRYLKNRFRNYLSRQS